MTNKNTTDDLITKFTKFIKRACGDEVKLVATAYFGTGLHCSVGVDVFTRKSADDQWHLCSDMPHPNWRSMSVSDYVKHGRSEKFQAASHGEILSASNMIGKPMGNFA